MTAVAPPPSDPVGGGHHAPSDPVGGGHHAPEDRQQPEPRGLPGTPQRIVVGVDGSASSIEALRWAVREARICNGSIRAVLAWLPMHPDTWPQAATAPGDVALESRLALARFVAQAVGDAPEVEIDAETIRGPAAAVLLGLADHADLLVLGDRGRGGFAGLQLGSVVAHCIGHAPCPVVIVRSSSAR